MGTVGEFIETAGQVLSDCGFEHVDASQPDALQAIRDRETSVLMQVEVRKMEDGEPVALIRAVAVTNFERPNAENALELLDTLSKLNSRQYFGTWFYAPEHRAVVLEHSLLVNHMSAREFAVVVTMLERTADDVDDQLSEYLSGETAKETLLKAAERSGMI